MIAITAAIGAAIAAMPALIRLWRGPTPTDRLAAAYLLGVIAAIALAACGAAAGEEALVTAGIVIVLAQMVVFTAVLKAARRRSFQPALAALRRDQSGAGSASSAQGPS
jgi:multisubunit Na+/H+ antiporter MnhF subunit